MTNAETREMLRENGFVRVDGLRASGPGDEEEHVIGDHLNLDTLPENQLGLWDYNNGVYAVLTTHRELWIRVAGAQDLKILEFLAPNGKGLWVPCSNGDWPSAYSLLARVANSEHIPQVLSPV